MNKALSNFIFIAIISFVFINCANRGRPEGGPKDEAPPIITKSEPENFSINFTGNEIRIYFDEFIKVKNLQQQLIISPPMNPMPEITPQGSASKYINIKIIDTLRKGKYNHEGKFLQWALRISYNMCVDQFRRSKRRSKVSATETFDIFDILESEDPNREHTMIRDQEYQKCQMFLWQIL